MAEVQTPCSINDENDIARLEGTLVLPDGIDATGVSTPDSTAAATDPITIETGSTAGSTFNTGGITIKTGDADPAIGGDAGNILIQGGDGDSGGGDGGDITIQPGTGDSKGEFRGNDALGNTVIGVQATSKIGFLGVAPAAQQTVTGTLSAVVDANAKAVLTSIIAALVAYGLAVDGTT